HNFIIHEYCIEVRNLPSQCRHNRCQHEKSSDTYRVRAYFKGFMAFYFVWVCFIQTNILATNSRNIRAVTWGCLAAAKKQIKSVLSTREHFVIMLLHDSFSKQTHISFAIPSAIKTIK